MPSWVLTTPRKQVFFEKTYFEESSICHTPSTGRTRAHQLHTVVGLSNSRTYLMATSCTIKSQRVQAAEYKEPIGIGD